MKVIGIVGSKLPDLPGLVAYRSFAYLLQSVSGEGTITPPRIGLWHQVSETSGLDATMEMRGDRLPACSKMISLL
jgi:hypothetical protein